MQIDHRYLIGKTIFSFSERRSQTTTAVVELCACNRRAGRGTEDLGVATRIKVRSYIILRNQAK